MHLDGARIWNAATNLKVQESDIAYFFDLGVADYKIYSLKFNKSNLTR